MKVVTVFPSTSVSIQTLARNMKKYGVTQVVAEGPYLLCRVRNATILSDLRNLSGVKDVVVAKQVSRCFSDVIRTIVEAGTKAILTDESFYVKVIQTSKADYVERDIEFAAAGALIENLAKVKAVLARNESDAERVILAIVGKKCGFVCVKSKI